MLERLKIDNFQSLRSVDLELKKFTVIVGPSSSGKTAVIRALRVLHENSRGAPYVSHGAKTSKITLQKTHEKGFSYWVKLERGGTTGAYEVAGGLLEPATYTKLAGAVPDAVSAALDVSDTDLVFAGQFDRPYLLDETGSAVARVLGELTNVSVIFNAAREANRRKLETGALLKTRQTDLVQLIEQAKNFKSLPSRIKAITELEEILIAAQGLENQVTNLVALIERDNQAHSVLANIRVFGEIPDLSELQNFHLSANLIQLQIDQMLRRAVEAKQNMNLVSEFESKLQALHKREHDVLVAAGVCPTCNQETRNL